MGDVCWQSSKAELEKILDKLDKALLAPKRWRLKLIKWIFPEICDVADALREYYWNKDQRE